MGTPATFVFRGPCLARHLTPSATSQEAAPSLKTDGSITGLVEVASDPKGPTGADLRYQTRQSTLREPVEPT